MSSDRDLINSALRRLAEGARFTEFRTGVTSPTDPDGNVLTRANQGCRINYVWVRFDQDRAIKQVLSTSINNEAIGLPVEVAFDNIEREDVVYGVAANRATYTYGEVARAFTVPENASQTALVSGERFTPGLVVKDATSGGLYVRVLPHRMRNGDWWDGNATLALTPTSTLGKQSLVLVGIDPRTSTLVQALAADREAYEILIPTDPTAAALDLSDMGAVIRANPDVEWKGVTVLTDVAMEVDPRLIVRIDDFGYSAPLSNYSASAAPTASDDIDAGYSVGSVWFDGADIYDCVANGSGVAVWELRGGSSVEDFTDLGDVPSDYTGEGGNFVRVKGDETGLEFAAGGAGATDFTDLADVPASYTGHGGKVVAVKSGEDGLEFVPSGGGAVDVTDGITTVLGANTIEFTSGAMVTDAGGGVAEVAISGSGGSGNTIARGTYASLPVSATTAGDMYLSTDSAHEFVWTGTVWKERYKGVEIGIPKLSDFSWVNQGSTSASEDLGTIYVSVPSGGGNNLRILTQTIPSGAYKATICFSQFSQFINFVTSSLILYNSGSGAVRVLRWGFVNNYSVAVQPFTNVSTPGTDLITRTLGASVGCWLQIEDTGTTRYYRMSYDGGYFDTVYSEASSAFTPTHIGIAVFNNHASNVHRIAFHNWKIDT